MNLSEKQSFAKIDDHTIHKKLINDMRDKFNIAYHLMKLNALNKQEKLEI
jgi:hypothetical protein